MAIAAEAQFHVLAVDDSLVDRKLIERLLKSSSFQVTTVDSGSKALEFLGLQDEQRNGSPASTSPESHDVEVNLIITDYCMPGMTGYDLLKRVKESASFKDIPVVIMSSENVPSRIDRCLAEGAEEFFLKPVRLFDVGRLRPYILKAKAKERLGQDQVEQQPEQQQEQQQLNNKRKAGDDGITQESRKQRFNGLTVV